MVYKTLKEQEHFPLDLSLINKRPKKETISKYSPKKPILNHKSQHI